MKTFLSLPKTNDGQAFYSRYATLVPTLNSLGVLAQIVSALTEFGVVYSIIHTSLAPLWPGVAPGAATVGAVVGTAFLELGLRKFAPYSARAIIHRRFSGWDGWITGFVLAATLGLFAASAALSFRGAKTLVAAVAPEAEQTTTAVVDSAATASRAFAEKALVDGETAVKERYGELMQAVSLSATADLRELTTQLESYERKEARTGSSYATRIGRVRESISGVEANRDRSLAALRSEQALALAEARDRYRSKGEGIDRQLAAEREQISTDNRATEAELAAKVSGYGGGLAYFTLFCLTVFVVAVVIKELHHAGAGIAEEVEPGAYDFEARPVAAFATAVRGRLDRALYGAIHRMEIRTPQAPVPVAAPLLWGRESDTFSIRATHGQPRPLAPLPVGGPATETRAGTEAEVTLSATAVNLLSTAIELDSDNQPEAAAALRLKADHVLSQYLGPKGTAEAIADLRDRCVDHLNGTAPNPFAHLHERRPIGFNQPLATDPNESRITTVVSEVVEVDKHSKPCGHCSTPFLPKNYRHTYCCTECRIEAHAARHGGQRYDPNRKPWDSGKGDN